MSSHETQRRLPYARSRDVAEFDRSTIRFVQEVVEQRMERLISSRNALVLRHGQTWEFARGPEHAQGRSREDLVRERYPLRGAGEQ